MAERDLTEEKPRQEGSLVEQFTEPLNRLRNEVDRLFDDFPMRWPSLGRLPSHLSAILPLPAIEMTETDKAYKISVEIPGIPADEIEVEAEKGLLLVKGEKKEEREEKERSFTLSERSFGAFERRIGLPADADLDKIEAKASNGVLKITIGRNKKADPERRKIQIKGATKT